MFMYIWDRKKSPPLASKESGHAFVSRRPCWPACAVRLYITNISKRCVRKYSTEINRDENSYELVFVPVCVPNEQYY